MSKIFTFSVALVLCFSAGLAQVTTGTISGTVTDETGGILPGVEVTVTHTDTNLNRSVVTDDEGRYIAPNLSLGNYEVQVGLTGFRTGVRSGIQLTIGREAEVDFTLAVGEISERVIVEGEAPLVEATTSTVTSLVDDRKIRDLPLNGRSFSQLAALQAGVAVPRHMENVQPGNEGDKISIAGTRITQTSFLLDGTDIRNHFGTTPGSVAGVLLGVDTVREFSVVTTGASAEFGIFTGGVINAVSRSGTNELHGSVFEFHRNSALDARNFFDKGENPPHFVRNQFGFTIGGPVVKDKTFFFGSYEALRDRLGVTRTAKVPTANGRVGDFRQGAFNFLTRSFAPPGDGPEIPVSERAEPFFEHYPLPNDQIFIDDETGFFIFEDPVPTDEDYFMLKIDHIFNDNHTIFGRYTLDDSEKNPFLYSGIGPQGRGWEEFSETRFQVFTAKYQMLLTPTLINEAHFGFMRSNILSDSTPIISVDERTKQMRLPDRTWGAIFAGNIQGWGPSELTHLDQPLNRFEFADNVVWTRGRHNLKFGLKVTRLQFNIKNGVFAHGTAIMVNYTNFLQAQPLAMFSKLGYITDPDLPEGFEAGVGGPLIRLGLRESIFGFFVQDDFKATPNLTLNMGVRYEFYKNPTEIGGRLGDIALRTDTTARLGNPVLVRNPSLGNVAPRMGIAWDPFGDGKMSIRAGAGIFYDLLEAGRLLGPQGAFPFHSKVSQRPAAGTWPDYLETFRRLDPNDILPATFTYGTPNQSYISQWNLTVQRELLPETVLTVGYVGSRGVKLSRLQDVNIIEPQVRNGRYFWPSGTTRPNTSFTQMRMYLWDASSFYHSFQLGVEKRFSEGFQFQANYTWSKALDEGSNTANSDAVGTGPNGVRQTWYDTKLDRARSSFDIPRVFNANVTYELPFGQGEAIGGWKISALLSLNDGPPLNARVTSDIAGHQPPPSDTNQRPDLRPGFDTDSLVLNDGRDPNNYFDLNAFLLPTEETGCPVSEGGCWGNFARNGIPGPGTATVDLGLRKDTRLGDDVNLEFRAEFFNILNRANWRITSANVFSSPTAPGAPARSSSNKITTTSTTNRQIQFALKLTF